MHPYILAFASTYSMFLQKKNKKKNIHSIFSSSFEKIPSKQPSKLIPLHPYGTRKNSRRKMEDLEKGQENLIEDVNSLKGTISKVLEALQVIVSKIDKENQPTEHVESVNPSSFYVELQPNQGAGVKFSLFGLLQSTICKEQQ